MSPEQVAVLKSIVSAEPSLASAINSGYDNIIADWLNTTVSPAYYVWRSETQTDLVLDAISGASMTPADAPDGTTAYTNRALICQAKQINLQILLQGRALIATGKLNIRQWLSDSLLKVPSGVGGAEVDAGWAGAGKVKAQITRLATRAEKALASGNGTTATPSNLTFQGDVSINDAGLLR